MWPWEHLAFGYLWLSLASRVRGTGRPSDEATVALAVGTQFPDLVDKPLAWGLGVLPSGVSLGHSILFALPVVSVVTWAADRRSHGAVGAAFGVGYLSHIAGDGLYPLAVEGEFYPGYMLWPLVAASDGKEGPLIATVGDLWVRFVQFLGTPRGRLYLGLELLLLAGVAVLWFCDGAPGVPRYLGGGSDGSGRATDGDDSSSSSVREE